MEGRKVGVSDRDVNVFTGEAAFSTLTNVDFDPDGSLPLSKRGLAGRPQGQSQAAGGKADFPDGPATFNPGANTGRD